MQITLTESHLVVAQVVENVRGRDLVKEPALKTFFDTRTHFFVSIMKGKGEIEFKKINGIWFSRVLSVDYVFGIMKGAWSAVE